MAFVGVVGKYVCTLPFWGDLRSHFCYSPDGGVPVFEWVAECAPKGRNGLIHGDIGRGLTPVYEEFCSRTDGRGEGLDQNLVRTEARERLFFYGDLVRCLEIDGKALR
jgi:hypothetical protein